MVDSIPDKEIQKSAVCPEGFALTRPPQALLLLKAMGKYVRDPEATFDKHSIQADAMFYAPLNLLKGRVVASSALRLLYLCAT